MIQILLQYIIYFHSDFFFSLCKNENGTNKRVKIKFVQKQVISFLEIELNMKLKIFIFDKICQQQLNQWRQSAKS
jgi:hypothetical protein